MNLDQDSSYGKYDRFMFKCEDSSKDWSSGKRRRSEKVSNTPKKLPKLDIVHDMFNEKYGKFLIKIKDNLENESKTKRQRVKNKIEITPPGYILPEVIQLRKFIDTSRLSKKEFMAQ